MLQESDIAGFSGAVVAVNNSKVALAEIERCPRSQLVYPGNLANGT